MSGDIISQWLRSPRTNFVGAECWPRFTEIYLTHDLLDLRCSSCGRDHLPYHSFYREQRYRDLPILGLVTYLVIDKYREGLLNHCGYPINSAKLEGTNNKIKIIRRVAYGFHDDDYFILKIKQACSKQNRSSTTFGEESFFSGHTSEIISFTHIDSAYPFVNFFSITAVCIA